VNVREVHLHTNLLSLLNNSDSIYIYIYIIMFIYINIFIYIYIYIIISWYFMSHYIALTGSCVHSVVSP